MQKNNLHLRMLSVISNYHYNDRISERANKEAILDHYGLLNHSSTTVKKSFNAFCKKQVESFLHQECKDDKYCSVLIHTGKNESIGGCGVIYIMSKNDIKPCLNLLNEKNPVTVYSRRKSTQLFLSNFDNYKQKEARFGGGFRIQVNGIRISQGRPMFVFLTSMSFDDFGSRVLSEATALNSGPPVKSVAYEIPVIDGKLAIRFSEKTNLDDVSTAEDAVIYIIEHLLMKKSVEISRFLRDLMSLRPIPNVHQLEGIYGVGRNGTPTLEIIDFDGIDVFDIERQYYTIYQSPQEKLFGYQLEDIGFIKRIDIDAISTYFMQEAEIIKCTDRLGDSTNVPQWILLITKKNDEESLNSYFSKLKLYIYTARILKWLIFTNHTVLEDNCILTKYNNIEVYWLDIAGVKLAFLLEHGELVQFSSEDCARKIIIRIFGSNILPACLSYAREGD